MQQEKEIYFHVGLGKVASTYLQHRFFPKLEGIEYIPTGKYRRSKRLIAASNSKKILISREFDRQLEEELRWFASSFPKVRVIIIFRPHAEWIASQYRRYVKNGFHWPFDSFVDLDEDKGIWSRDELILYRKIEIIEQYAQDKPLVLFYRDLRNDPWSFFDQIAEFCGATYPKEKISMDPVHRSYSEKQLIGLRRFCRRFKRTPPKPRKNKVLHWILYRPWWAFFHLVMYTTRLFPDTWTKNEALIPPETLARIESEFKEDWNRLEMYAR